MTEKMVHIKSLLVFKHEVNGPAQLVGIDSQGLALVVFSAQPVHIFFGLVRFTQADHGRCPDGPFKMGVTDLLIGFTSPFTVGLFFRTDQPGIRTKALHLGKALDILYLIKDDQGQLASGKIKCSAAKRVAIPPLPNTCPASRCPPLAYFSFASSGAEPRRYRH